MFVDWIYCYSCPPVDLLQLTQYRKNSYNPAKFHPDRIWNDEALSLILTGDYSTATIVASVN